MGQEETRAPADGPTTGRPDGPPIRVMALHALLYCERLFYLEEVEEIRVADGNCASKIPIHSTGDQSSWAEPPPTFQIV